MNITRIIILGLVVSLSACHSSDEKVAAANTDTIAAMKMATDSNMITAAIDSNRTAASSAELQGTYKGVLPCADCEGIQTAIMLHADNTYMISAKLLGKKDSKEMNSEGKFVWIDGTHIQLEGLKDAPSKFLIGENKITQLGTTGNIIQGASAEKYILTRNK